MYLCSSCIYSACTKLAQNVNSFYTVKYYLKSVITKNSKDILSDFLHF